MEHGVTVPVEYKRMASAVTIRTHIDDRATCRQFIIHHLVPVGIIGRIAHVGHRRIAVTEVIVHGKGNHLKCGIADLRAVVHFYRLTAIAHQLCHGIGLVCRIAVISG